MMQRQLAAIVAADVVGYSSLMGADEEGTLARLSAVRREVINPEVEARGGRIVKTTGDGFLMTFASAVAAVQCATAVQAKLAERHRSEAPEGRIVLRIGINLGDVIVESDSDVYGDGVNIAARLESLAEPGSIYVSRSVRDQVRDRLPCVFDDLGEHAVKNIARPVRVFRVTPAGGGSVGVPGLRAPVTAQALPWRSLALALALVTTAAGGGVLWLQPWKPVVEAAVMERMAFPLPDVPSLAVVPFTTLSAEPGQDYLGDGLSESIIAGLSKVSGLFVVAGSSTAPYKQVGSKVKTAAEELGVRYVLTGSLQRTGPQVRVVAQLVDALSGRQIWADRFDRGMEDLLKLQDEITLQVVTELRVRLTEGEQTRLLSSPTVPLEAVELSYRALEHFRRFTRADNEEAKALAAQAASLSPDYAFPLIILAWSHWMDVWRGWAEDAAQAKRQVLEYIEQVEAVGGPDDVQLLYLRSAMALAEGRYADAVDSSRKVIAVAPSFADGRAFLGVCLVTVGKYDEAIDMLQQAMRLSPVYPTWYLYNLAAAYRLTGRNEDAEAGLQEVLKRNPEDGRARLDLAIVLANQGRGEEAKAELAEYLKRDPGHSLRHWLGGRYVDGNVIERELALLKQLGLPD